MEYIITFIVLILILGAISSIGEKADQLTVSGSTKWHRTPLQAWFRQVFFGIIGFIFILALLGAVLGGSKPKQETGNSPTVSAPETYYEVPSTVSPSAGAPYSPTPPADNLDAELPPK